MKKWIYLLAAAVVTCGISVVKPVVSGATSVDIERACSLKIFSEDPEKPEEDKYGEDLASAEVVVDLYYIADTIKTPGYDTYVYQLADQYQELKIPMAPTAKDWQVLTQQAAEIALDDTKADTPAKSQVATGSEVSLKAGLYLVIARGADLISTADS